MELSALAGGDVPAATALRAQAGDAASLAQLAYLLSQDAVRAVYADPAFAVPDGLPGMEEAERRRVHADAVLAVLRNAYPSAAAARVVENLAADEGAPVGAATARFLRDAVFGDDDFDLAHADLGELADLADAESRATVLAEARRVQRLFRLSTGEQNLAGLLSAPLHSAHQIATTMTEEAFVGRYAAALGGELEAALSHRRALSISTLNLALNVGGFQATRRFLSRSAVRPRAPRPGPPSTARRRDAPASTAGPG